MKMPCHTGLEYNWLNDAVHLQWWASLVDLQGSKNTYRLVPITPTRMMMWMLRKMMRHFWNWWGCTLLCRWSLWLWWSTIFSRELAFSFQWFSVGATQILPTSNNVESCFGLTLNSSCISHWVVPFPNLLNILQVNIAVRRHVGLSTHSFAMSSVFGFEVIVSLTMVLMSTGRSVFLDVINGLSKNPSSVLTWISGLVLVFKTLISWAKFNVFDNLDRVLHDLLRCSCVTSRSSNNFVNKSLWSSVKGVIPSMNDATSLPLGTSLSGIKSSNNCSISSVLSLMAMHVGFLMEQSIVVMFALATWGSTFEMMSLNGPITSFITSLILPMLCNRYIKLVLYKQEMFFLLYFSSLKAISISWI